MANQLRTTSQHDGQDLPSEKDAPKTTPERLSLDPNADVYRE